MSMRMRDHVTLLTFAECAAAGKAAGWEDFIGIDDYAQELVRLTGVKKVK